MRGLAAIHSTISASPTPPWRNVRSSTGPEAANRRDETRPRRFLGRVVRWGVTAVLLAVFPFILLVRGGVFAYQQWELGAWPSLAVSTAATALLLACYAWAASRRLGAGKWLRKFAIRVAALAAAAFVLYAPSRDPGNDGNILRIRGQELS